MTTRPAARPHGAIDSARAAGGAPRHDTTNRGHDPADRADAPGWGTGEAPFGIAIGEAAADD